MHIKLSLFRGSPLEVFSKKDAPETWSKPTGEQQCRSAISNKSALQLNWNHTHAQIHPKIRSTCAEHPPPGEHLWGTASACKKNFKRRKLQKVFITVVERNLLTLKMNKQRNKQMKITNTQWQYTGTLEKLLDSSTSPCYFDSN